MKTGDLFKDVFRGGVEGLVSAAEVVSMATGFPTRIPYHQNVESEAGMMAYTSLLTVGVGAFLTIPYSLGKC